MSSHQICIFFELIFSSIFVVDTENRKADVVNMKWEIPPSGKCICISFKHDKTLFNALDKD